MTEIDHGRQITCPRCKAATHVVKLSVLEIDRCDACGGIWFDIGELKQLRHIADERQVRDEITRALVVGSAPVVMEQIAALGCPLCGLRMARRPHEDAPGVVIDRCQQHGTWLDHGEALRLLALAKHTEEARARAIAQQHEPKQRGWLSALLDLFE